MSYRLPGRALGQALSRAAISRALPRTGIAGSGITWEMVGLGAAVVGGLAVYVAWEQTKSRLWKEAIPDADERFMTRLATGL